MDSASRSAPSAVPTSAVPAAGANLALIQSQFAWVRTRLSVARTILAWTRTGVSLIGFGFTIYQFFQRLQEATAPEATRPQAPRNFGLALIGAGVLALGLALWQHRSLVAFLRGPEFGPLSPAYTAVPFKANQSVWVTALLALIGLAAFLWILVRG
jgi:putative membrane protein